MASSNKLIDSDAIHSNEQTAASGNQLGGNNCFNGTITTVKKKCKTLILKLKPPQCADSFVGESIKPEEDIDQIIDELGNQLICHVIENINSIRDEVKKARPREDDPDYETKVEVYKELLEYVTNLIKKLTNVFDKSLTNYRRRVEQLWDELQSTSDWGLIEQFIKQFEKESESLFDDAIQVYLNPYLLCIESRLIYIRHQ